MFAEMFYTEHQVPGYIRYQQPLVLSPSNPHCNLMAQFKPKARKVFSHAAAASLRTLHGMDDTSVVNLCDVFRVKPARIEPGTSHQITWLVGHPENSRLSQPVVIVRKTELEVVDIFPTIKMTLTAYLHAAVIESRYHDDDQDQFIRRKALQFIHDVFDEGKSDWLSKEGGHDNYDVTFEVPVIKEGRMIKISCNWREGTK